MEYVLLIVGIVVLLIVTKRFLGNNGAVSNSKQRPVYQYTAKTSIMTPSESEFFKMLVDVVGDRYYIFPQVHLSALLDEKTVKQNWKPAFRHINGKSVDFVLSDKATFEPIYAVELDDKTHERVDRQERDREVERMFQNANIPLVRFSSYKGLSQNDIIQRLFEAHSQKIT